MMFTGRHWDELFRDGYTIVRAAVDAPHLGAAQEAAAHLNAIHPDGGWERSKNELWREIRDSDHPAFVALANDLLDPLALEILESVATPDRLQLASTLPGFSTAGIVGRHFHIDGGRAPSLAVFNVLLGVALTPVTSDTAGGFHVLPGSHRRFAEFFGSQPTDTAVDWGEMKRTGLKLFLTDAMVVPQLAPGDVIVAHCFLAHGTSANTTGVRRDMIFQRRAARPLADTATQLQARETFMRDPWAFFRHRP
ncbi:MAG: phytanoyl-CoA dioxygenase family protein [Proteobacteria bacterium]|nr:phytanoyl-CoA dioxygenase family protein [Pseudomonadota bacterium]